MLAGRPKENKSKPGTSSRSRAEKRVPKRAESCASGLSHTHTHTHARAKGEAASEGDGKRMGALVGAERHELCSRKNFTASAQA